MSPNRPSLAGTTFGASSRPVLSPTNHTVQGKISGFATHRRAQSLSPRPGPGAHQTSLVISSGDYLWTQTKTKSEVNTNESLRLKSKVNALNLRLSGELGFETLSKASLRERRNELCRQIKDTSSQENPSASFTYSLDQSGSIESTGRQTMRVKSTLRHQTSS